MQQLIVTDLGFGDCGKGTITAALCRKHKAKLVVRYNGGAQASHNVKHGLKHAAFHMFGSGTFEGARTLLSQHVLVDPLVLYDEEKELKVSAEMMTIDPRCLVVTDYHKTLNRFHEHRRGLEAHGSCGMGIGTTMQYWNYTPSAPTVSDIVHYPSEVYAKKLADLIDWCMYQVEIHDHPNKKQFTDMFTCKEVLLAHLEMHKKILEGYDVAFSADVLQEHSDAPIIFEGAQGVLLDQDWGFHPHTTWSKTTSENARSLIQEMDPATQNFQVIGVIRAYQTRHGNGPLPTETTELGLNEVDNPTNKWQGPFRHGWLDIPLTNYAIHADGVVNQLAMTCVDQVQGKKVKIATSYDRSLKHNDPGNLELLASIGKYLQTAKPKYEEHTVNDDFHKYVEHLLDLPVSIISKGPDTADKVFL